jgi:steroid delta-isomerase-like uncharacterized protein
MKPESMKEIPTTLLKRIGEVVDRKNFDRLGELLSEDVRWHGTTGEIEGLRAFEDSCRLMSQALGESVMDIEDVIAEGDRVAVRFNHATTVNGEFMGRQAEQKRLSVGGVAFFRIADGKVAEVWMYEDVPAGEEQLAAEELAY